MSVAASLSRSGDGMIHSLFDLMTFTGLGSPRFGFLKEHSLKHYDVIIAGCGPTGGVLGNLLAGHGLSVCVIEKYAKVYPQPRAIVLDWEVMRALQFCGIAQALAPTMRPHPGTDFLGVDGQLIKLFDPEPAPYTLGWPATLTFVQPELEKMLRRKLELRENVTTHFGYRIEAFADEGDEVHVDFCAVDRPDEVLQASARFLIGCDGANSQVRNALDLELVDLEFDEWWVVVDAWQLCDTDLPRKTTQFCWPSRPATYVVAPGNLRRWELKLLPGEHPEDFKDHAFLERALEPYVDINCFEIWRHAVYRFAARTGESWRRNRVFLAGDAVHQTPPFLGQGLCAGIRDAFNLAWKLAWVCEHGWNDRILDSYEAERRPHVEAVVRSAKEFGLIIGELDLEAAKIRDRELRKLLLQGDAINSRQKFIPDLAGGLLGSWPLAGSLMVQPQVIKDNRAVLLDDILPPRFLFLSKNLGPQQWMSGLEQDWAELGGTSVALLRSDIPDTSITSLVAADSIFHDWAERHGIDAVVVRPDRYIHAVIANENELRACIEELRMVLLDRAN